jgi:uncharacterized membrane protein YbhN (UPF0104 family)
MLSWWEAHTICIGLVAADYVARAWRISLLAGGVGHPLRFSDAMAVNTIGDTACALSPLRLAGEPARLAVMHQAGLPATAAVVAIGYEVLAAWPVIIAAGGALVWAYLPAWWVTVAPLVGRAAHQAWPWILLVSALTLLVWWRARGRTGWNGHGSGSAGRLLTHWRRMPWSVLLLTTPLSLINLASRVAILPVLAATLPHPPPLGPVLLGSFAFLYSQLVLPTPSGVGVVELGFMGGAAGDLGGAGPRLLVIWRLYTTLLGAMLGLMIGAHRFGWKTAVARWRRA